MRASIQYFTFLTFTNGLLSETFLPNFQLITYQIKWAQLDLLYGCPLQTFSPSIYPPREFLLKINNKQARSA